MKFEFTAFQFGNYIKELFRMAGMKPSEKFKIKRIHVANADGDSFFFDNPTACSIHHESEEN